MALARRRPPPGLIHHSDQGSQYVSLAFGRAAGEAGSPSDGLPRRRLDNAVAETFFATLKKELVNRRSWPRASNCSPPCSSTSRRSTTASAGTPPSGCSPRSPTNNYDSRRSVVEITRSNNNNQPTPPRVTQPAGPQTRFTLLSPAEGMAPVSRCSAAPRRAYKTGAVLTLAGASRATTAAALGRGESDRPDPDHRVQPGDPDVA